MNRRTFILASAGALFGVKDRFRPPTSTPMPREYPPLDDVLTLWDKDAIEGQVFSVEVEVFSVIRSWWGRYVESSTLDRSVSGKWESSIVGFVDSPEYSKTIVSIYTNAPTDHIKSNDIVTVGGRILGYGGDEDGTEVPVVEADVIRVVS